MTACNGHFLARSASDSGFIVADSEVGDFVAANLLSPQADLAWRGDSSADLLLQINLKEFELIDALALCLHNMTSTATITVDFYDSRVNSPLLTVTETIGGTGTIPQYKNHVMTFSEVSAQEIDITISNIGNPDGHVQIRRLKMGVLTVPQKGFDFGYTFGFVSGEKYRAGQITWMWNTEVELNAMNELVRDFGVDRDRYARTRAGELLGLDDDILWLGYPEALNQDTKDQHTALVAMVGADIPFRPNAAQGVFVARFEEVYYEPIVAAPTAFITTWQTTGAAETITLPATGVNSFVVDWGDDSSELVTTASPSHEYAIASEYVVSIEGICRKWYQNNAGDKLKIREINQWGDVGFTEVDSGFHGCSQCQVLATDAPNLSGVISLRLMFAFCSNNLQYYIANWNVSTIVTFTGMFFDNGDALEFPVQNWDVSSGRFFNQMFYRCKPTTPFALTTWDVQKGENFSQMLNECGDISGTKLSSWVITAATNMLDFLLQTNIDDAEYDAILIAWAAQAPLSGAPFNMHFGTAQYSAGAPATARAALVTDGITITDGGPA